MKTRMMQPTVLALALVAAFPAAAQSNEELARQLRELRAKLTQLEAQVQPGMTPEQQAEFNRIATKTEGLQDTLTDKGFMGLKIGGYIEPAFVYNRRQQRAGFQFLNISPNGYTYDTSYMGAAVLDLLKETEGGTLWHLVLAPNRSAGLVVDGASIVQEASVSIPIDGQYRILAGQIPDWSGYEYQQPTLNPFTSHNLLFDFTLPTAYTGAGLEYKEGQWWVRTVLGNVNATMRQSTEKSPVWAFRVDYAKGEFSGWGFASLVGKAPRFYSTTSLEPVTYKDASGNDVQLTDSTGTPLYNEVSTDGQSAEMAVLMELDGWYTRSEWTLAGQVSYGKQKRAAITADASGNPQDAQWVGVSGMVGYSLSPRLQLLARADYLRNNKNGGGFFTYNAADGNNGIGPGQLPGDDPQRGANRYELTLGVKYLVNPSTTFKAEMRWDGADRAVFYSASNGTYKKNNQMVASSVVVAF